MTNIISNTKDKASSGDNVTILLMGKPGCGKDTQAQNLHDFYDFSIIKMGSTLRELAKSDEILKKELDSGDLADNDRVNKIVANYYFNHGGDIVSTGFPRDIEQAIWLDVFLKNMRRKSAIVMLLDIADGISYNRVSGRSREQNRQDDNTDIVSHRLDIYYSFTTRVIEHYKKKDTLFIVNGEESRDKVWASIEDILLKLKAR